MSCTYSALKVHVIFSTKCRQPCLDEVLLLRLSRYAGAILSGLGCQAHALGGHQEHLHVVFGYPPQISIADAMKQLKGCSSAWIRREFPGLAEFRWQDGYSAYSVSPARLPEAIRYVESQRDRHRTRSFEEEYLEFLALGGIEFNEADVFETPPGAPNEEFGLASTLHQFATATNQ